jgi:hypothetical protein
MVFYRSKRNPKTPGKCMEVCQDFLATEKKKKIRKETAALTEAAI